MPTLEGVLDGSKRPKHWSRSLDPKDYDVRNPGWTFATHVFGKGIANPFEGSSIYDTTQIGYSNAGHTFGDRLSAADREVLLEYLKSP